MLSSPEARVTILTPMAEIVFMDDDCECDRVVEVNIAMYYHIYILSALPVSFVSTTDQVTEQSETLICLRHLGMLERTVEVFVGRELETASGD